MEREFESNITNKGLFNKKHRLLLAISGGVDSVVLAHLLKKQGFTFSLAHCNFKLRAKESNTDEDFCRKLAKTLKADFYTTSFDTNAYAKGAKLSLQMAARKLRYDWFNQLIQQHGYNYLLTAHHANDVVETVLLNLLRGTGIKGLKGIADIRNNIARPLLPFTKEQILVYAKNNNIRFRLDKSNLEDKYERNFLRHKVVPKLKTLHPHLEQTIAANCARFAQEAGLLQEILETKKHNLFSQKKDEYTLNLQMLAKENYRETILHFILTPFGFNQTQNIDILNCMASPVSTGKLFFSTDYEAVINRNKLVIRAQRSTVQKELIIYSLDELKTSKAFTCSEPKQFTMPLPQELLLDAEHLIFPLRVRFALRGDKFIPFGMKGFKLLSDFMREQKMSVFDKQNCRLLVNGNNEIIWIIGQRSDERYRVDKNAFSFIKLSIGK